MNTEKLYVLLKTIECGSITAAAEELHFTPSGVSRTIESLEKDLGLSLFLRSRSGVSKTAICEELLPYMKQIINDERILQEEAAKLTGLLKGTIRIGVAYAAFYPWLAKEIAAFQAEWPGVRFELRDGFSTPLYHDVEGGTIDLALVSRREGSAGWFMLLRDELVALLPLSYPLSASQCVPLSLFEKENYIDVYPGEESDNERVFRANGIVPKRGPATRDANAMLSMVEAGLGIGMNNQLNIRRTQGKILTLPLDPPQIVEIGIAFSASLPPAAETFYRRLQAAIPDFRSSVFEEHNIRSSDI